jgi:hypothetical protein
MRPVKLDGKVVAREPDNLRVLVDACGRRELLYLTAADSEIFERLYSGSAQQLEIEDARIVGCRPADARPR